MIRVRIFSDYCDSTGAMGAFKSWGFGSTTYKNLTIVDDDSYTHAVILNHGKFPKLNIPKENVIGFHQEIPKLIDMRKHGKWLSENVGTYYVYDKGYFNAPFTKESYTFLPNLPLREDFVGNYNNPAKPKKMSIIASWKSFMPGHRLRHEIIKRILKSDMDIDIYGSDIQRIFPQKDSRIKGTVEYKPNALSDYMFNIVIENDKHPMWITEKFVDPVMCSTVPLYWGAPKIDQVFGANTHIKLPHGIDGIMNTIKEVYNEPDKYYNSVDLSVAHENLRGKANFAEFLIKVFS